MKLGSYSLRARAALSTLLFLSAVALFCAIPLIGTRAQNPTSGSVGPAGPSAAWDGTIITPIGGVVNMESLCVDGVNCEVFTLTVTGTKASWAGKHVQVQLTWSSASNEYDIYIHKGNSTAANTLVTSVMAGPGLTNQTAFIDIATNDVGVYTIHVAYDTVPAPALDHYHGTATAAPLVPVPPPAAPSDPGPKIGYENFEAPGVLTPGTSTSSGAATVEYLGRNAGEPSVGSNWATGVANFQSDLETLFVTFDDSCSLTTPKASWVNRRAPTSVFIDSDPIGFTDRGTVKGRVFAGELTLLSPDTVKLAHTDDDGVTWIPAQSGGVASAVDHQTVGGGIYNENAVPPPPPPATRVYPGAVYYCSQDIAFASCSRSDDGGTTYGASIPIYALTTCGGLHGHVKVSPKDGTVYVPNRSCNGNASVVVSRDNGATWAVRSVQNGSVPVTTASDDPSVGIDNNGRVYFLFANNGTSATVATSDDYGQSWQNIFDVSGAFNITNVAFPAAVGGIGLPGNLATGRAAVAFYATKAGVGDSNTDDFTGVWHLYIAHTFDGGSTWTTTDATPVMPMQRSGLLRGGGGPVTRNLLDFFDMTIDRDGRVLVGYVNGCSGGNCAQAPIAADGSSTVTGNAYTVTATIARQSSGRRMIVSKDPVSPESVPGMPFVTQRRVGQVVTLAWNEADNGFALPNNSTVTNYQIFRGTSPGGENPAPIATLLGTATSYTDSGPAGPLDITKTYYYKVIAINSKGPSCANNEVAAPYIGDTCTGLVLHRNLPSHPESTGGGATTPVGPTPTPAPTPPPATPQLLIDYIAVGEPPSKPGQLMFKMKVVNLSPTPQPNSRWRMVWDSPASPVEQYYVGMTTDGSGLVSFEYGTLETLSLVVVGVPTENPAATPPDPASNYNADGTITIYIPKSAVGNPQVGDLLGAVNGRTFASGDTPPMTLERSTLLVDHTFVKGSTDASFPPATYTVSGNNTCSVASLAPVGAVSRKTHGSSGDFDIDLPLTGSTGIECRTGPAPGQHKIVFTFLVPVNTTTATATCGGQPATVSASGSQVTVTCTGIADAQTIAINLNGVSDGTNTASASVLMSVLLGDVDATTLVDGNDVSTVQGHTRQTADLTNYREDVNCTGLIDGNDVSLTQGQTRSSFSVSSSSSPSPSKQTARQTALQRQKVLQPRTISTKTIR